MRWKAEIQISSLANYAALCKPNEIVANLDAIHRNSV
jgi:hypothetical protein